MICLYSFALLFQYLHDLLETCRFKEFWNKVHSMPEVVRPIAGFEDSIRKFVCHVVGITYQVSEWPCSQFYNKANHLM